MLQPLPSLGTASKPLLWKSVQPQATAAHVAPLEPEHLLGTLGSFSGDRCHGFILLITEDIDIHPQDLNTDAQINTKITHFLV